VLGWKAREFSSAIEFGLAFHHICEHVSTGAQTIEQAKSVYIGRRLKQMPSRPEEMTKIVEQAAIVCEGYFKHWEVHNRKYTFLQREKVLDVRHKGTRIRGKIDGIVQFNNTHGIWETKTKGRIDEEGIERTLDQDTQTMLYCLGYALDTEVWPTFVLYDVVRQPAIRQTQKETLEQFHKRLLEDIAERPDHYFIRWHESVTRQQIQKWQIEFLDKILCEIGLWYKEVIQNIEKPFLSPRHYRSPKALLGLFGGAKTEFFDAWTKNDYSSLYRSKIPFPELAD